MNFVEWVINSIISTVFATIPYPRPSQKALKAARVVAHRGAHKGLARENSLRAFELCIENKIWATELDVRFTADDEPIIVHDENGLRNWQKDITFATSTFRDIRSKISEILTLEEVVSRFGKQLHLMIEIKENLSSQPHRVQKLARALAPLKPIEHYHLLALDPQILEPLTFAPKTSYLDVIWINPKTILKQNRTLNHGAVAGHFLFFSQKLIAELKTQQVAVGVGFLDSKNSLYREINRGADYIFTDHALHIQKILSESIDANSREV
jgi:glycerophosphoryl diester phosphodiesterase